jgi:hypothetical protein
MSIPNLHDRRVLEEIVAGMDAEAIVRSIHEGGLSGFAEEVAMEELARRVLADHVDFGPRARGYASRLLGQAGGVLLGAGRLAWLASLLGLIH